MQRIAPNQTEPARKTVQRTFNGKARQAFDAGVANCNSLVVELTNGKISEIGRQPALVQVDLGG